MPDNKGVSTGFDAKAETANFALCAIKTRLYVNFGWRFGRKTGFRIFALKRCRQPRALVDRTFCIQLSGDIRTANDMHFAAFCA